MKIQAKSQAKSQKIRHWRTVATERPFEHRLFGVERERLQAPDGDEREVVLLDTADWVNVIALLGGAEPEVVLVRQWRFGVRAVTLEIPGGMVEPGESALETAGRELLEETGYRAGSLRLLGQVLPNPAIQRNRCTTWLASDLELLGEPAGDGSEELEVVTLPLLEVPARIAAGEIAHSLVIAAFYLFGLDQRGGRSAERDPGITAERDPGIGAERDPGI